MPDIASQLMTAGLSAGEATKKVALLECAENALSAPPTHAWFVPGRIEVLGKHTDYAGGRSLLCAAERGMCVLAAPAKDGRVTVVDAILEREAEFDLEGHLLRGRDGWVQYLATTLARLVLNFGALRGARIAVASDLPRSAGMSSSSVLVIATALAVIALDRLDDRKEYMDNIRSREDLAAYLACIENGQSFRGLRGERGVGTFGGSEDHTAILCCRPRELALYRFCPAQLEDRIPLPGDTVFAIASSGVIADKTGAARDKYNRAARAAAAVLQIWREATGRDDATLFAAATSSAGAPAEIRRVVHRAKTNEFSSGELMDRFEQFCHETVHIMPAAVAALRRGDVEEFGWWVDESQSAAELWLGNQVPETIALARSARELGAPAASAFGAGFGGAVWALVERSRVEEFLREWREKYQRTFPDRAAQFFPTAAGPAVVKIGD